MSVERPIGVFDSGVGGLTVFHALERELPDESLVYLGDTARVPYGTKSPDTVLRYALEAARFLKTRNVQLLVVACNTASSVALDPLEQAAGCPVIGVIVPGARRAVEQAPSGRIGVIGTRATIASGAYEKEIQALRPGARVLSRPCPLFVPLAEEGWTDNDVARDIAATYLAPLREAAVEALVLGCTHYPLLKGVIAATMGPGVALVDSADSVAAEVRRRLPAANDGAPVEHHFFVTDAPDTFQQVAERFLGRRIANPERASL